MQHESLSIFPDKNSENLLHTGDLKEVRQDLERSNPGMELPLSVNKNPSDS